MKILLDDGTYAHIEEIIPGNSVVIVSAETDYRADVAQLAESLKHFKDIFDQHKISAIASPYSIKWTVIPDGK